MEPNPAPAVKKMSGKTKMSSQDSTTWSSQSSKSSKRKKRKNVKEREQAKKKPEYDGPSTFAEFRMELEKYVTSSSQNDQSQNSTTSSLGGMSDSNDKEKTSAVRKKGRTTVSNLVSRRRHKGENDKRRRRSSTGRASDSESSRKETNRRRIKRSKVSPTPSSSSASTSVPVKRLSDQMSELRRKRNNESSDTDEMDEEERRLQELRIQQELHHLCDLKEIIMDNPDVGPVANIPVEELENPYRDEEYEADMGDSDVDEFEAMDDGTGDGIDSRCPPPAPGGARKKWGRKSVKAKLTDEGSQKGIKEMCSMVLNTFKAKSGSLIKARMRINQQLAISANSTPPQSQALAPVPVARGYQNDPNFIIYQDLRRCLGIQEAWFNEKKSAFSSNPDGFIEELCSYNLVRNNISHQVFVEHLCWLSVEALKPIPVEEIPLHVNGVLPWVPSFQKKFANAHPVLQQDARPNSKTALDLLLCLATAKVQAQLEQVFNSLLTAHEAIIKILGVVKTVRAAKQKITEEFELVHDNLCTRNLKLDENCTYGLKQIRTSLEPPYFKSADGLMAVPMFPDAVERTRSYNACFFTRDKQKWTTKDLSQLKDSIYEVLLVKRLNVIRNRYQTLMIDCINQYEAQIAKEGRSDAPLSLEPYRRKRGRPKKSELEISAKYGMIHPILAVLPNGIVIRNSVTPRMLSEWRYNQEKEAKSLSYEELVKMANEKIDWIAVANKMVMRSRKKRTPEDCKLVWRHENHPTVNNKRWDVRETKILREEYTKFIQKDNDWVKIAALVNQRCERAPVPGPSRRGGEVGAQALRTPYQCFFRVRNKLEPPKKLEWNEERDMQVLEALNEFPGNWRLVATCLDDPTATKRAVIDRYKKAINPILRNGAFSRVEDCLLILTIEKLKPFLAREGHFGCLLAYLPWRCETTWRDRANNLFSDWIVPWTIEEDKKLLQLAKTMNRNWQRISEQFSSFKNRKGCLTRWKILERRLKEKCFNGSLEAYHEAYAMTRYNVFQYKHLKEILKLLTRVRGFPLAPEHHNFPGLLRNQEPTEVRLQHMLLTYDRTILNWAIKSLERYVQSRDSYWQAWMGMHGERKRTFDRRTFHPENPQSVASALHIQGLKLKNQEKIKNRNEFESEIYKYYGRFCRTKQINERVERPYLPDPKTLAQWSAVSRLIVPSSVKKGHKLTKKEMKQKNEEMEYENEDDKAEGSASRKWSSLNTDFKIQPHNGYPIRVAEIPSKNSGGTSVKRPYKKRANVGTSSTRKRSIPGKNKRNALNTTAKKTIRKKRTWKRKGVARATTTTPTVTYDSEGYLLVPPELSLVQSKRGKLPLRKKVKPRKKADPDPEFRLANAGGAVKRRRGRPMKNMTRSRVASSPSSSPSSRSSTMSSSNPTTTLAICLSSMITTTTSSSPTVSSSSSDQPEVIECCPKSVIDFTDIGIDE